MKQCRVEARNFGVNRQPLGQGEKEEHRALDDGGGQVRQQAHRRGESETSRAVEVLGASLMLGGAGAF